MRNVIAFLMTVMLTQSCATADQRLAIAATTQGQIKAGVILPVYPDDCRDKEPHAEIKAGAEIRSTLIRERAALDIQNGRTDRCAAFYDDVKDGFARK